PLPNIGRSCDKGRIFYRNLELGQGQSFYLIPGSDHFWFEILKPLLGAFSKGCRQEPASS
ncbi:MAG: hypothetical protein Q8829_02755, partial [Candidatus Phytoplasma australasiaticum]|nr:hypothetical protein [Candidatus Phytoplasma australasiaticum]